MFERFTDRARRALVLAQDEARLLNHNFIGTEHLLLGLAREDDGVAAKALASLGIRLDAVRQKVTETIGPEGGFRLRYTLERHEITSSESRNTGRSGAYIRQRFIVIPVEERPSPSVR